VTLHVEAQVVVNPKELLTESTRPKCIAYMVSGMLCRLPRPNEKRASEISWVNAVTIRLDMVCPP